MAALEQARELIADRRHEEAIPVLQSWLEDNPGDADAALLLGESLFSAGFVQDAERIFRHCIEVDPSVQAMNGLGLVLAATNRPEEAHAQYELCLQQDETIGIVWRNLASVHRFGHGDGRIQRMKKLVKSSKTNPPNKRDILFGLVKAMEDLGEWERAWSYAERAVDACPDPFDPTVFERELAEIKAVYDAPFIGQMAGSGNPTDAPVFIVGMPRSGTTLAEAVLARHDGVAALGELQTIPTTNRLAAQMVDEADGRHDWVRNVSKDAFAGLAETCLRNVRLRAGGEMPRRYTDKLPGNLANLGLIALMFPNARIIRMHRDPLDTCVSCYLRRFSGGLRFTQQTGWLAAAYRFFQAAGDHYASVIGNPVLDVRYEDLVTKPEAEIRRIVAFAGLDWQDACLTPEAGDHAVSSASGTEVRREISAGSIGRWRRYGPHVAPLATALGYRMGADFVA